MEAIEANWMIFAAALLVVMLAGWLLFRRARSTPERREYKPDVLDAGAASIQRNQALIDAAPAAQIIPPAFGSAMAGVAEAVAVGAQDVVEEAEAAAPMPIAAVTEDPVPTPGPEIQPAPAPAPSPRPAPEIEPVPETVPEPAPTPEIQPLVEPVPAPVAPETLAATAVQSADQVRPDAGDDLSRIKGLGPKLQALLPTLGLSTYAQIAALTDADLADLDKKLGAFAGRPAKDSWVEQASFLAVGDVEGFEGRFGKV